MSKFHEKRPIVLVVEDDLLIRLNAVQIVEDAGFDCVEAGNADEAVTILEVRPDIHLIFTDVQMHGSMDGLKLAAYVKERWPPICILATSGLVNVRDDDLPPGSRFLPKPYTPDEVKIALRELI